MWVVGAVSEFCGCSLHDRQEAILAAISEKDAHIAVLEMAPNKKTENIEEVEKLTREKLRLQQVLKDLVRQHPVYIVHNVCCRIN